MLSNTLAGIKANTQLGADYIFESKIYDISSNLNDKTVTKYNKTKPYKETHYSYVFDFKLDIDVVSVETGESVKKMTLYPNGWYYPGKAHKSENVNELKFKHEAVIDFMSCIEMMIRIMILEIFPIEYPLLDVVEQDKDKIKKVSIAVGNKSIFQKGQKFDIMNAYTQELGGQEIERKEKIGDAKFKESYLGFTVLDIKKGKKELFPLLNGEESNLICVQSKVKTVDKCTGLFQPAGRKANRSTYSKLATDADKPKTMEELKKEDDKTRIQKKKVEKKKG